MTGLASSARHNGDNAPGFTPNSRAHSHHQAATGLGSALTKHGDRPPDEADQRSANDPSGRAHVASPEWQWKAILALKPLDRAKTRLTLAPAQRRDLALAMAFDTAIALRRSPRVSTVILTCPDPCVEVLAAALGVHVLADEPEGDINSAFRYAIATLRRDDPHPGHAVALVAADLPAASPAALTRALAEAERIGGHAVLADSAGTGTTMLTVPPGSHIRPRFGPDSFRFHQRDGAMPLCGAESFANLRQDVDTTSDLARALTIGVGTFTTDAVARFRAPRPRATCQNR
jgi:2-phospho-L-lactate/phosphoenolpyruvate guanylyltransferase